MTTADRVRDFVQFTGRFDRPVSPSPAFTKSLREKVFAAESGDATSSPPLKTVPARSATTVAWDSADGKAAPRHREWPRFPRHLQAAAAILIVLSLVSSLAIFRQPDEPSRLLFQPAPGGASIEVNQGGNPGRTWNFGDVEPALGDSLQPLSESSDLVSSPYNAVVVGDSLIAQLYIGNLQKLIRYDLNSQTVLWSETYPIAGPIASDGARIFAVSESFTSGIGSSQLMAIDVETGRVAWMGPLTASRVSGATSLLLMDGRVFVADFLGNVLAVDAVTGSTIWSTPETILTPTAEERMDMDGLPPNLVGSEHGLYVAYSTGEVSRFDAATGQKLESLKASEEEGDQEIFITLSATDSRLLARVAHAPGDTEEPFVDLLVLDPLSLEVISELQVYGIFSNVVLLRDLAYFAVAGDAREPILIVIMDLNSGEIRETVPGISAEQFLFLSASGGTLMVTTDLGDVIFIDTADHSILFHEALPLDSPAFPRPALMWNEDPITIPGDGNIYGFFTVTSMSARPVAMNHGTSGGTSDSRVLTPG